MKRYLRNKLIKWLGLKPRLPEVYIVLGNAGVDSVWFDKERAEKHIAEMSGKAKRLGVELNLRLSPTLSYHGSFILDVQNEIFIPS
jgi:hypothetical protein